jgi:hypothetical protein
LSISVKFCPILEENVLKKVIVDCSFNNKIHKNRERERERERKKKKNMKQNAALRFVSNALFVIVVNDSTRATASAHFHKKLECVLCFEQIEHGSFLVNVSTHVDAIAVEKQARARSDSFYFSDRQVLHEV